MNEECVQIVMFMVCKKAWNLWHILIVGVIHCVIAQIISNPKLTLQI